jgi:peptide/nickel transport system permease protein
MNAFTHPRGIGLRPVGRLLKRVYGQRWSQRIGVVGMGLAILIALFAPLLTPYDPATLDLETGLSAPSLAHPFGTDQLGRDVLTRTIFAARIDLQIGFFGVLIPLVIGVVFGLIAGYFGRWVDVFISRTIDVVIAFPFLVLVIAIVAMLGPGLVNLYIGITVVSWVLYARMVRGEVLGLKNREYALAARGLGYRPSRIMFRHILPNAIAPALVFGMSDFVLDMQVGATLSFFGLGVQPPAAEWGLMIAEGRTFILTAPWVVIFPGVAIIAVSFFFSLVGDALADSIRGLREQ